MCNPLTLPDVYDAQRAAHLCGVGMLSVVETAHCPVPSKATHLEGIRTKFGVRYF